MIALLLLLTIASATNFEQWTAKHKKHYTPAEALRRRAIFNANKRYIIIFNREHKFKLSLDGPFAAMTNEEYKQLLAARPTNPNKDKDKNPDQNVLPVVEPPKTKSAPAAIDWRAEGKVPAVRDQASCGSCYAFGSLAALESRLLIAGNTKYTVDNLDLSEQQIVDCSDRNSGCNGGNILFTFAYTKKNGVMLEKDYPYTALNGTCQYDANKAVVTNSGEKIVTQTDEAALMEAIAEGPVAVAIDASQVSFQLYSGGVYDDENCKKWVLNHAVCAVGYGATDDGVEYYIVRNSWGASWGEDGYVLLARNNNNQCGIANDAIYPTDVTEM